jgi:phosphoserine phosphatase
MLDRSGPLLLVMDVDSTVIEQEVIELIASFAGVEAEVRRVTESAMRGEIDFGQSLRERVALLAGLPTSVLDEVKTQVRLTAGARELCETLQERGDVVALVSGGFDAVVESIATELAITDYLANRLEIEEGRLTGRIVGRLVDRGAKAEALREFALKHGIPLSRTVAVGDGANDLEMIRIAALGIAFNAKAVLREQADAAIDVRDLRLVLDVIGA